MTNAPKRGIIEENRRQAAERGQPVINKAMRAALRALSYPELDVKKNYKLQRGFVNLTSMRLTRPPLYQIWDHAIPCGGHMVPVRVFSPPDGMRHPVLIFFHGGGWVTGNIDSYDGVCTDMAHLTNRVVVSVDYRLAPEARFPAAPEDCYAVAREIYLDNTLFGTRPEEIALIGDSAGGNLTAAVSLMARDRGEFLPARQILLYPATAADHSDTSPYASIRENGMGYLLTAKRVRDFMELYMSSEADLQNPYFAPLEAADLTRQPATLVITAQYCPLRDEGEAYGKKLREAGNRVEMYRVPDALHGYFSLPARFTQVKRTYGLINRFLQGRPLFDKE